MKSSKAFKIVLGLIVAIFIINQLVSSLYMPIKTENAVFFTANDGFKITGHIIRNETYVTAKTYGILHFVTEDGSRVAKNGVVANISFQGKQKYATTPFNLVAIPFETSTTSLLRISILDAIPSLISVIFEAMISRASICIGVFITSTNLSTPALTVSILKDSLTCLKPGTSEMLVFFA